MILVIVIAAILKDTQFFQLQNIINILRSNSVIGIIAMGMTLVIISGGIDLSVGSVMVMAAAVSITVSNLTGSVLMGVISCIAVGIGVGALNSIVITKGKVPPFIATLGMMNICRSLSQFYMNGGGMQASNETYKLMSNSSWFGIPTQIFYLGFVTAAMWFISKKTSLGRHIYAIGSNEKAAKLSSINVTRVKLATYSLIGLCVSIAAIVESSRMNSINASSSGVLYELDAISAVVVGGTSMAGGKGSVIGTLCGVMIIGVINNMMILMGVPPFLVSAVKGAIVILAVLLQRNDKE